MENLLSIWNGLDLRRRITLVAATAGVFFAVLFMAKLASAPSMALLYSGMEADTSGQVIAALDARGVQYDIRGSAIYVPVEDRDRLRMSLAAEGLPENSAVGYELLEQMSGFGTTSQMFDAAYWRAKEGELARTISAAADIKSARVHIARESGMAFQRAAQTSASVTLTMLMGQPSKSQARAIQFLVASAVPQLSPEDVAIIDAGSGQIVSADANALNGIDENSRQMALKQGVERILAARLGPNRSVVEVSLETVSREETIVERRIDPNSRIVVSTDTEERVSQSEGTTSGGVTVASNLPEGDAGGGNSQSSNNSETRERINYDMSQTERQVRLAPGAIKRVTVAVLVDGLRGTDAEGNPTWEPRSEEELRNLQSLVEAAVGFDAERGDSVTIHSMEFELATTDVGTEAEPRGFFGQIDLNRIIPILLVIFGGLLLMRMIVKPAMTTVQTMALPAPEGTEADDGVDLPALKSLDEEDTLALPQMATVKNFEIPIENDNGMIVLSEMPDLPFPAEMDGEEEVDPVERLKELIKERQEETIEILRGWMEEREEDA